MGGGVHPQLNPGAAGMLSESRNIVSAPADHPVRIDNNAKTFTEMEN